MPAAVCAYFSDRKDIKPLAFTALDRTVASRFHAFDKMPKRLVLFVFSDPVPPRVILFDGEGDEHRVYPGKLADPIMYIISVFYVIFEGH